jgi:hypothetical protein
MRFEARDIQGLLPAVDPRSADKIHVVAGANYVLDSKGPRSVFGNRFLTPYALGAPEHIEGMRLRLRTGDRVFNFTSDSIIEWDESAGGWRPIYYFDQNIAEHMYRWTGDYLDGIMFFCHPAVGILAFNLDSDLCLPLEGPGVPSEPISICVCSGRLVVIDESAYTWSAPGDGTIFIPELGGAGFQAINARVPGYPLMVSSYARGTLTWTTGGVMRSEFSGDAAVWRHRALVTEYRPINSYCTFRLDNDTIGFLDERGFFQTQGESPKPLTPLFNEFLIDYIRKNNLNLGQNIRVEFDDLTRRIYLSISLSEFNPTYTKAFVLYVPLDKWGEFNEEHFGIHPLLVRDSSRADDYFGFTDVDGRARFWTEGATREVLPTSGTLNSYYPVIQKPAVQQLDGDAIILSSTGTLNTVPTGEYTQRAGYYDAVGTSPTTSNVTGLDAFVNLGLVRARSDVSYDRMLEVNQVYVGSLTSNPDVFVVEDWNAVPDGESNEDWNVAVGNTDYGFDDVTYVNHGLQIIGTVDGRSAWQTETPELIRYNRGSREYSTHCAGMFHIVRFTAFNVGESFHVASLELTASDAGRLN